MKVAIISFARLDGAKMGKNLSGVKSDSVEEKDFYFFCPAAADCPIHPKMSALSIPGQVATIHCDQVATIPGDYITRLV